jgi:selenocysteine lyase/cysteine desulfurase
MYSATNPALQSALTAFVPLNAFTPTNNDSVTGSAGFVTRLREDYNLVVRSTTVHMPNGEDHYPLRVSTHLFHDRRDVDYAVEAIVDLAERFASGDYGV